MNYDEWRLASPPGYDLPDTCPLCGEQFDGEFLCKACGWTPDDEPEPPIGDDE